MYFSSHLQASELQLRYHGTDHVLVREKTLPSKRQKTGNSPSLYKETPASPVVIAAARSEAGTEAPCMKTLLAIPVIRALSLSGLALAFVSAAFDVLFVLFSYTPIQSGGLAFTVRPFPFF